MKFLRKIKKHYVLFAKNGETTLSGENYEGNFKRGELDIIDSMIQAIAERLKDEEVKKMLFRMIKRKGYTVVKDPSIIIK